MLYLNTGRIYNNDNRKYEDSLVFRFEIQFNPYRAIDLMHNDVTSSSNAYKELINKANG